MLGRKTIKDIETSRDGDFIFNKEREFEVIENVDERVTMNLILNRFKNRVEEWEIDEPESMNFDDFVGSRLTLDIIQEMKERIMFILSVGELVPISSIFIQEMPITSEYVEFLITIRGKNNYDKDLYLGLGYDMRENKTTARFVNPKESLGWQE